MPRGAPRPVDLERAPAPGLGFVKAAESPPCSQRFPGLATELPSASGGQVRDAAGSGKQRGVVSESSTGAGQLGAQVAGVLPGVLVGDPGGIWRAVRFPLLEQTLLRRDLRAGPRKGAN